MTEQADKGIAAMGKLSPFLLPDSNVQLVDGLPVASFFESTEGMKANAYYFGQPVWVKGWLDYVHRSPKLRERWLAVAGNWDNKMIVDVGCGPGNLFRNLSGNPATLIGVDIARGSLESARELGYVPLLADAHALPLRGQCADVVALNAALHHCDDMRRVLIESARLVKPGGLLVADHDPQCSAYDFRGLGKLMWNLRMPLYRFLNRGGHRAADNEQEWAEATEIHHKPGDGVTTELFESTLRPLGFEVALYLHNHDVGREITSGKMGHQPFKVRVAQRLSGIRPASKAAALSILCVARKSDSPANGQGAFAGGHEL